MREYLRYCADDADGDAAPLYVFDAKVLDEAQLRSGWSTPRCFSHDAQACISGSRFRPLPPAWLLVGTARSGTPMHNHPSTVAWVPLLMGIKAWVLLPPDVDESALLLLQEQEAAEGGCRDYDLSALEWFGRHRSGGRELPEGARVVVQRPGEVVYAPAGWWHVVLNVETSIALSHSLALRRDIDTLLPQLIGEEESEAFGMHWMKALGLDEERRGEVLRRAKCKGE